MVDRIFADTAPAYYAKGLPVIPLYSREKRPVPTDWSRYFDQPVEASQQEDWIRSCGNGNIGLVLGPQSGISMLDIDVDDEALLALIQSLVPKSPWVRVGQKGMVLAFKYTGLKTFRIKTSAGQGLCELLSDRTQVVLPPSIHPKTQMPYKENCQLLDVLQALPPLDNQIEHILRGAFKEHGIELSLSGSSKVTDFVSSGARDSSLTEKAGLFAYAVMRGERTLKEAIGMLRSYNSEFVENVAGDEPDVEKHVQNLIRFLHRDVTEKGRVLPAGWDDDLENDDKLEMGVLFDRENEEWSMDEMIQFLRDEFERNPKDSPGRMNAVDRILDRCARSPNLTSLEENRILQYIADVSRMNLRVPMLRKRVAELRQNGIEGTDHAEIAQHVVKDIEQTHEVRKHGNNLWKWVGSHWEVLPDDQVMARIATDYGHLQAGKRHSDHKGVMATIHNIVPQGLKTNEVRGVNFANGFLTEDLKLAPHDPSYGMTYTLPFRYLPQEAGNSPLFFQFLDGCWAKDVDRIEKTNALQEALAVTLFGMGPRYQRAILLKGVAKAGKSQMLKVAQSLVPDEARCFVPPNEWQDRFMPTQMHEKLINVCGELSEKKKIDGQRFKDIIDGTEMSGQKKGKDIFHFRPLCTHWFASNHTPKTDDSSEGFNRRWLVLEFNHPVPAEKRRIDVADAIVADEREAIVAWAVKAMERLQVRSEYTIPPSHEQIMREVAQENNSVRFFLEESPTVRVGQGSPEKTSIRISEDKLYKTYWSFCCGPAHVKPVGQRAFRSLMRELQSEKDFHLELETNEMGVMQAYYRYITLATEKANP